MSKRPAASREARIPAVKKTAVAEGAFAWIFDPDNKARFSKAAALKAFAHVK